MDTYLYKSARKNMIVCGLHENKMTKYSNNTIMVGELPFIEIGNCSFTFFCRSGMVVFFVPKSAQISINILSIYVHFLQKKNRNFEIIFY
jgi:hypothetical protein